MIQVRLMSGSEIVLNSDLIEVVEATPDTVISLSSGKKLMVQDSVSEVVDKVVEFRGRVANFTKSAADRENPLGGPGQ
jgi:flagellar protein FlbD